MEKGAFDYFGKLDAMGQMAKASSAVILKKKLRRLPTNTSAPSKAREKIIVGANEFVIEEEPPHTLYIDESVARHYRINSRPCAHGVEEEVQRRVEALKKAAAQEPRTSANGDISSANTMPYIVDAVRAYATVGEICEALREVFGTYTEVSVT